MVTVREALRVGSEELHTAGVTNADREATWLLAHILGTSAGALRARAEERIAEAVFLDFRRVLARRVAREPIQYILGTEEFMGMTLQVSPAVLIPRLDTETLVREAAGLLPDGARVADIGTGSGAIALGVASLLPHGSVVATDISPDALEVARRNADQNGLANRIEFRQGDLLDPLEGERFDAILSNPPYISEDEVHGLMPEVRGWEPWLALTPGPDGLAMYRRLLAGAPLLLKPGGLLGVEVGAGQAAQVRRLFDQHGFRTETYCDSAGIERAIIGWKAG